MAPSQKKKSSSSSTAKPKSGRFRTLADVDADLENLAGVVVSLNNHVLQLDDTFRRLEEHVQELDLKIIFTMNAVAITRKRHGGIIVAGQPETITKKLMEWYREGGRDQLVMKLQEAENELKKLQEEAAAHAGEGEGEGAQAPDAGGEGGADAEVEDGEATTSTTNGSGKPH